MTQMYKHFSVILLIAFATTAWSQEVPPAKANPAVEAKEGKSKFSATLVLIKADWSASPHAKEVETELREALKDASVPKELLANLPQSGPEILFGPQTVALYSEEHHAELMAWLKAKDLILSQDKFERAPLPPKKEAEAKALAMANQWVPSIDGNKDGVIGKEEWLKWGGEYYRPADLDKDDVLSLEEIAAHIEADHRRWRENTIKLSKDDSFIELPKPGVSHRPFVTSQIELLWRVYWSIAGAVDADQVAFSHQLTVRDQVRGQESPSEGKLVDNAYASVHIKEGRVLVMNAFPVSTEHNFRQAARAKGFEAVVMIGRSFEKVAEAAARVHAPDWIDDHADFGHEPRLNWGEGLSPSTSPFGSSGGQLKSEGNPLGVGDLIKAMLGTEQPPVTKIIHLQHASAAQLRDVLLQLAAADIKLVVDERTNAIIVSGSTASLAELEAIALRLDEPDSAAVDNGAAPKSAGTVAKLKQQYADAEAQAAKLAKESKPAKDKLRAAVAQAFELRQKLLQAELAEFRQRTQRIEQSLQQREGIKQQIIERRVEDLLRPGFKWEPSDSQRSTERAQ